MVVSPWKPIESAPKDGRVIIVADWDAGAFPMNWGHIQKNILFPDVVGMWVLEGGGMTWDESRGNGPTFWMEEDEYSPEMFELLRPAPAI